MITHLCSVRNDTYNLKRAFVTLMFMLETKPYVLEHKSVESFLISIKGTNGGLSDHSPPPSNQESWCSALTVISLLFSIASNSLQNSKLIRFLLSRFVNSPNFHHQLFFSWFFMCDKRNQFFEGLALTLFSRYQFFYFLNTSYKKKFVDF